MQFIQNGPDVPDKLLQAHEDGQVVFFCGAGISYPAGLPGFKSLVKRVYDGLGEEKRAPEASAFRRGLYDTVLSLLEARVVRGRTAVREHVADILRPNLELPHALETHEALLTLCRTRSGQRRLITTNFDRLFEIAREQLAISLPVYQAPLLPVPKNRWDGLVYLHGLLPQQADTIELDKLVISSGDFGIAYLTERWAARFVSDLFRTYTVCFVGYSINDPVLRYMMDALAADRLKGESPPEAFAFGSYSKGKESEAATEWETKNVTPILYREHNRHAYLRQTLSAWASTFRDGVLGKESIVARYAVTVPTASTAEDDYVGRLLWALSDPSGLPAKRFAEFNPLPSLDWLAPMASQRFGHTDLERFGVRPEIEVDDRLTFSLVVRPPPYMLAAAMSLVLRENDVCQWDHVMRWVAHWLSRHLDNEELLQWVASQGSALHPHFAWTIERHLNNNEVRPVMRRLWRLVLSNRLADGAPFGDPYDWRTRLARDGYSPAKRLEFLQLVEPHVRLSRPRPWLHEDPTHQRADVTRAGDLVSWEVVLASAHAADALREAGGDPAWGAALPHLLWDATELLRDALDLMRELDGADDRADMSYIARPSISEHEQNRDFHDWTFLIVLLRDAWLAALESSPDVAKAEVRRWLNIPYPVFRRLVFFAATQNQAFPVRECLNWLLADEQWWLWSVETEREAIRLLVWLADKLDAAESDRLQQAVLNGPPRRMFRDDVDDAEWERIADREIWMRLEKYQNAGGHLTPASADRLAALLRIHPQWRLAEDERDEFPFWMGDGEDWREYIEVPRTTEEITEWLQAHPQDVDRHWDNWQDRCRTHFQQTSEALIALAQQGHWYPDRWRGALQVWADGMLLEQSWDAIAATLADAPDQLIVAIAHSVTWWLQEEAKAFEGQEDAFFALVRRIVELHRDQDVVPANDIVGFAINHPIGHAVQAALSWWYRQQLRDGQGLDQNILDLFTELSDTRFASFRYGRLLLAAHVITLYRVDRQWTEEHLLPNFDWNRSITEATAAWKGFLWSPRLYLPLISRLGPEMLATANHYDQLGDHADQYSSFLTYVALQAGDLFTLRELRETTAVLPLDGKNRIACTLVDALEGSGEQRSEYWANRIQPYIARIWPKSRELINPRISESFTRLAIAAGDEFPQALETLRGWLVRTNEPGFALHKLVESGLCARFPRDALSLLDLIIGEDLRWRANDLRNCIGLIRATAPQTEADDRYQRLLQIVRRLER
jgi:SIR2-like domain